MIYFTPYIFACADKFSKFHRSLGDLSPYGGPCTIGIYLFSIQLINFLDFYITQLKSGMIDQLETSTGTRYWIYTLHNNMLFKSSPVVQSIPTNVAYCQTAFVDKLIQPEDMYNSTIIPRGVGQSCSTCNLEDTFNRANR